MSTVPMIHIEGDTARTRMSDPLTSHEAADRSQVNIREIRFNVYQLIDAAGVNGLTGKELNALYAARFTDADWDTPRKRISELVADELVVDSGVRRDRQRVMVSAPVALMLKAQAA